MKGDSMSKKSSRRQFLKTSSVLAAGATLAGGLTLSQSAHAQGSDQMKVALIGIGSRGSGAIRDRAQVGDNYKIVAIADAFEATARNGAASLRDEAKNDDSPLHNKVDLPADHVFGGFDAYKKAIACLNPGDMAVIATPPGFRPYHYRAAIERGCHVFMEKPLFIDAPGFKHVMETNELAEKKGLKVCVGLQRHYEPHYYNWIKQIHAGAIGDIQYTRVYWNQNIWCKARKAGESEMDYQMRNWYHFVWLCGDNICEQHCHNLDIGNWIHGKSNRMAHPVEANAQGGRTFKAAAESVLRQAPPFSDRAAWDKWYAENEGKFIRHGQAWDHFFVEFTYDDGSKMFSQCRHISNCFNAVTQFVNGTKGYGGSEPGAWFKDYGDKDLYKESSNAGQFQLEHALHTKAVRENLPMNNGWSGAMATMTAVFGRMAAFSGKELTWDDAVAKGKRYTPNKEVSELTWNDNPPIMPDADGFYESHVAKQGIYNPFE